MNRSIIYRLDEKSRRCWFFAIVAAKDSNQVEPKHLLAALQKELPDVLNPDSLLTAGLVLPSLPADPMAAFRKNLERDSDTGSGVGFDYSKPLSETSKKAIETAEKAAQEMSSQTIGGPHLLLGLFMEDPELRRGLNAAGLDEMRIGNLCRSYQPSQEDVENAEQMRKFMPHSYVSGIGYDLHRLAEERKLMIGGVEVPFDKGSVGHSDGDVLCHALCDALLGAAGLGDIGTHFPDTDPKWKGAASLLFLEHTRKLLDAKKLRIVHLDAVVICERPKLGPHFPAMQAAIAKALGIAVEQINLKAKTNEGTGEIGRGEAIAAHTIATLEG